MVSNKKAITERFNELIIYTCLFNDCNTLLPPKYPGYHYICFADKDYKIKGWRFVIVKDNNMLDDAIKYKIFSARASFGYSIYHDPDKRLEIRPDKIVSYLENNDIFIFKHPTYDCVYDVASDLLNRITKDKPKIKSQMNSYKNFGYPAHNGYSETGFIVRKYSKNLAEFEFKWYLELRLFSKLEQLSFDFVRWYYANKVKIKYAKENYLNNSIFTTHGNNKGIIK